LPHLKICEEKMSKVKVICEGFKSGVILQGKMPVRAAFDGVGHAEALPPERSYIELRNGVNHVEADEIQAWANRAEDCGLSFSLANNDVYVVRPNIPGQPKPAVAAPSPTMTTLERALASDRIVSAR
jgi:hypothetical protein